MSGPSRPTLAVSTQLQILYVGRDNVYTPAEAVNISTLYHLDPQEEFVDVVAIEQSMFSLIGNLIAKVLKNSEQKDDLNDQMDTLGNLVKNVLEKRRLALIKLQEPHIDWKFPCTTHELTIRKTHQVFHDGLRQILADHQSLILDTIKILENDPVQHSTNLATLNATFEALEALKPVLYTRPLTSLIKPAENELAGLTSLDPQEFEKFTQEIAFIAPNVYFANLRFMHQNETNFKSRTTQAFTQLLEAYPIHPDIPDSFKDQYEITIRTISRQFQSNAFLQQYTHCQHIHHYLDTLDSFNTPSPNLDPHIFDSAKAALGIKGTSFYDTFAATIKQIDTIEIDQETKAETTSNQIETKTLLFKWMTIITLICLADFKVRDLLTTEKGVEILKNLIEDHFYPPTLMTTTALVLEEWRQLNEVTRASSSQISLKRRPAFLRRHKKPPILPGTPQSAASFVYTQPQQKKPVAGITPQGYQGLN